MNRSPLRAYDRLVKTPFGLLGTDENALSFALGYTFQQCTPLLQWFLRAIGVSGVHQAALQRASINLQQHRSGEPGRGITDIEVHLPGQFHVIIEAKVELAVPTIGQCRKYLPRFHDEPSQKLVALIQSPDSALLEGYAKQDRALSERLVGFHWADFIPECIRLMLSTSVSAHEKEWVRSFYSFLDQEYLMKAFSTEVWILPISTEPLWPNGMSHWEIHRKYRVWWDYREHSVRPLYLAFRVDGKLDSIWRVNSIEHDTPIIDRVPEMRQIKDAWPKKPATIWHFDPAVSLTHTIRTGGGMYNRRVRCDVDLLLSCETVQEIEAAMSKRRRKSE
jgi:hypothetical protein